MPILVTGAAGFIGMHVCHALLDRGESVIGIDNLNEYYDSNLKRARLATLQNRERFEFYQVDIACRQDVFSIFDNHRGIEKVLHLAAQAGVRYSLIDPYTYISSNIMGHVVVMEACRRLDNLDSFVYASSSSVYGKNKELPFSVDDRVDLPASLYAATKRADELISFCYSQLYDLPSIGLRFFTVYGPWGRPDMSLWLFTEAIMTGQPIHVFNQGQMKRDFTYIDDIVDGVVAALDHQLLVAGEEPSKLFNLGNCYSESLLDFINVIEEACGHRAEKIFTDMQAGDVEETWADIDSARNQLGFDPKIRIKEGIPRFVDWFKKYYGYL